MNHYPSSSKSVIFPSQLKKKFQHKSLPEIQTNTESYSYNLTSAETLYRDPWFYNSKNISNQIDALKTSLNLSNYITGVNHPILTKSTNDESMPTISANFSKDFSSSKKRNETSLENETEQSKRKQNEFIYKQIFKEKGLFRRRDKKYIDNKINIDYAETEKAYEMRLAKRNKKLRSLGKPIRHQNKSSYIEDKLSNIKGKINFMKGVIDYTYPGMVVKKIKEIDKAIKENVREKKEKHLFVSPYLQRNIAKKELDIKRTNYLGESFKINHF